MGTDYWPWSCPGADLPWNSAFSNSQEVKDSCKKQNEEGFNFVSSLPAGGCPKERFAHLSDPTVYDSYSGLQQSSTCYDVVACSPKTSCLGNNTCDTGYEYSYFKCLAWNAKNPDKLSCQTDDDCRDRSGTNQDTGLSSACSAKHPEDCARCELGAPDADGNRRGMCRCMAGGPRCALCRMAISSGESHDGNAYKGYFRLNNECQECPENPGLLIGLMALAVVAFCVAGWYLQDKKVNVAFLSIGVDYFQVLAIFARIPVKWPGWVKSLLQVLSVFNFNIDITAPECLVPEFDYKIKWIVIMVLPLIFAAVLLLIFFSLMLLKWVRRVTGTSGKAPKYWSHGNKLVAMFIIVFYFIYLSVTRRALDIFNCNPTEPSDGYTYTEFTSIDCEGGVCRCGDPDELQQQLEPYAIVGLLFYSVGFPLYIAYITWFYRIQMKLDQLLRAHELGDSRNEAIDNIKFTQRSCRSRSRRTYDIRKKYHKIYYHFKPGKVYWMLVILMRKFTVAAFALMFRANVAFMLAGVLLVLFGCYVLQVKHRPYMSMVERASVREHHRLKAREAELLMEERGFSDIPADIKLHYEMSKAIATLQRNLNERKRNNRRVITRLSDAKLMTKQETVASDYYFDYNTVEQVLIMSSIFLCLVAIMFESGQFYELDRQTGLSVLKTDSSTQGFYTTVLILGAIVLFGSLIYYGIVFVAEVIGHVPQWLRYTCANRKSRRLMLSQNASEDEDEQFEMVDALYKNPLRDLEAAKRQALAAERRAREAEAETAAGQKEKLAMVEQMKRLKMQNQRQQFQSPRGPQDKRGGRGARKKREMPQVAVDQRT